MKIGGNGNSAILSGTSSPDGVVSAPKGTLYRDIATGDLWQNVDGGTTWVPFSQHAPPMASGRYYWVPNTTATSTTNAMTAGTLRSVPFYVPSRVTVERIGSAVTVVGDVGSKLRLGIYADDNGRPGSLVVDAGTIDGGSASVQEIVLGTPVTIGPGWYWTAGVVQDVVTTAPTIPTYQNWAPPVDSFDIPASAQMACGGFFVSGVTGALPATFGTPTGSALSTPRMFIKTA